MFFLPLPIVVALMLMTVLIVLRERLFLAPSGRVFGALLLLYCMGLFLIGIRWGYNITALLPLQALLAVTWCPLAWIAFRSLTREGPIWHWPRDWMHVAPMAVMSVCMLLWPAPIDLVLIVTYIVYAAALMALARQGPDALSMVRMSAARICHQALMITAFLLFAFTFVDVLISLDIRFYDGHRAATIVALANVPSILILGLAAVVAGQGRSEEAKLTEPEEHSTDADDEREALELMPKLESLLVGQKLYKDPELNLQRLARKSGVPARRVSRAVNLLTGQNVSQWVNEQRITAACEQLKQSDQNITEVMMSVGFMTKSNFNREFKRITGTSPSGYRSAPKS